MATRKKSAKKKVVKPVEPVEPVVLGCSVCGYDFRGQPGETVCNPCKDGEAFPLSK